MTGAGCHFLLQGIFLVQGLNSVSSKSLALQAYSLLLSHQGRHYSFHCANWATEMRKLNHKMEPQLKPGSLSSQSCVPSIVADNSLWSGWNCNQAPKSIPAVQAPFLPSRGHQPPPPHPGTLSGGGGASPKGWCHVLKSEGTRDMDVKSSSLNPQHAASQSCQPALPSTTILLPCNFHSLESQIKRKKK